MLNKKSVSYVAQILFILIAVFLLVHYMRVIIFPLIYGFFLAMALLQPSRWLERKGFPRFLSSTLPVVFVAAILATTVIFLSIQGTELILEMDLGSKTEGIVNVEEVYDSTNKQLPDKMQFEPDAIGKLSDEVMTWGGEFLKYMFSGASTVIMFVLLVPFYAALILLYRGKLREYLYNSISKRGVPEQLKFLEDVANMIQRYVLGLGLVISIVAVLYGVGLQFLDIRYAWLLACFSAILITIPYVGAIIGGIIPTTVAWLTTDQLWIPAAVIGLYIVIQVLEGYILTPWIVGRSVNINPLVIILSMFLFGLVGGIMGVIIAVPLIATVKLLIQHSSEIKELAALMETDDSKED